jgi:hypothetical protein
VSLPTFHRLRAQRLAQLLDEADGGPHRHWQARPDTQLTGYVQLGDRLRGTAGLLAEPCEEFRAGLRARLLATAEREGIGHDAVEQPPGPIIASRRAPLVVGRRARGAVLVGLAAGTFALAGVSAISGGALPGDPLYGVKRSTENARLALSGSDASKGQLYLQFARNRLHEARGTGVPGRGGLDDMDSETRDGVRLLLTDALGRHDSTALDAIDGFVAAQRAELVRFGGDERVLRSVALLDRIAARSATVRASLGCPAPATTAPGRADDLGPLAPACPPSTAPSPAHSAASTDPAPLRNNPPGGPAPTTGAGTVGTSPSPARPSSLSPSSLSPSSLSPSSPSTSPSDLLGHLIHGVI